MKTAHARPIPQQQCRLCRAIGRFLTPLVYIYGVIGIVVATGLLMKPVGYAQWPQSVLGILPMARFAQGTWVLDHPDAATLPWIHCYEGGLMVGVSLWVLTHMALGGDGLHGRGFRGCGRILTVVLQPTMMIVSLVVSYSVFFAMSWLIMKGFTVASWFVLSQDGLRTDLLAVASMFSMLVTLEVTVAMLSFRLISTFPHHIDVLLDMSSPRSRQRR